MSSSQNDASEADYQFYEHVARGVQEKQAVTNYYDLTYRAFQACVHNFTHQELTAREVKCIQNTSKKWLSSSVRATARFAELQAEAVAKARASGTGTSSS